MVTKTHLPESQRCASELRVLKASRRLFTAQGGGYHVTNKLPHAPGRTRRSKPRTPSGTLRVCLIRECVSSRRIPRNGVPFPPAYPDRTHPAPPCLHIRQVRTRVRPTSYHRARVQFHSTGASLHRCGCRHCLQLKRPGIPHRDHKSLINPMLILSKLFHHDIPYFYRFKL